MREEQREDEESNVWFYHTFRLKKPEDFRSNFYSSLTSSVTVAHLCICMLVDMRVCLIENALMSVLNNESPESFACLQGFKPLSSYTKVGLSGGLARYK